jgi:broad specificity phosphatase PhoE
MKIYILRHEDRTQDCSFFSPLTKTGLENAIKLVEHLKKIPITRIYSSPFIRTLQTIYPYAKESKIKINVEYGLSELHHPDLIARKAVGITLPEYLAESFNYNSEYKTIIKPNEIIYPEKDKNVQVRVKRVLRKIIEENINTQNNIVIVTHQMLCNQILQIVNKASKEFKDKIEPSLLTNYEKGQLTKIFDSEKGWTFSPVN